MKISDTGLKDAFVINPVLHGDERGYFFEGFSRQRLAEAMGYDFDVAQVNHSRSTKHILRGLHYQVENVQAKLIWATSGEIFDVIVDLRRSSPHFGQWRGIRLSADNRQRILVPAGFAHGFLVTSEVAQVLCKTTDYYSPTHARSILWSETALSIDWSDVGASVVLSQKDEIASTLETAELPGFS